MQLSGARFARVLLVPTLAWFLKKYASGSANLPRPFGPVKKLRAELVFEKKNGNKLGGAKAKWYKAEKFLSGLGFGKIVGKGRPRFENEENGDERNLRIRKK